MLQNTTTGQRGFWWMNGAAYYNWIAATTEQTSWRMVAAADFTGDAQNDIVFQNEQTGQRGIWVMNGSTYAGWRDFYVEQPVWDIAAAHDADGDGKPDLLFQNRQTGLRGWALMNGTQYQSWVTLGVVAPEWDIVGTFRLPSTAQPVVTTDSAGRAHAEPTGQTNFPTVTSFYGTVHADATTTFQTFIDFSQDASFAYPARITVTPTQVGPDVFLVHAHVHVADTYYRAGVVTASGTVLGPVQFFRYPLPPQGPPVTVSVDPVTLKITLSWTSPDSGAVTVYRTATSQDAVGGALGMGPHEAVDSTFPVDVSRTYRYFTRICDDAIQCGPYGPFSDPVPSPVLARPTNLQMTSTGDSTLHVTLNWTDNAPNERGYFAFFSNGANESFFYFNGGRMYPPNTTTATYTNGNTSYSPHQMRAYVVAVGSNGRWSLPSDTAVITVPGIP